MTAGTARTVPPSASRGSILQSLGLVTLVAAAVRFGFAAAAALPNADPWRHMSLVRNLRSGLGFTLFDGQPYFWYAPLWYRVAALLPPELMKWVAAFFSTLAAPLFTLFLRRALPDRQSALAGGLLFALCGPLVQYTGQLGAEGFALFLLCAALALSTLESPAAGPAASGLLFGLAVVCRLQLALLGTLFLPFFRRVRPGAAFSLGALVPLVALYLRNHSILATHPIVFSWDGVATRSSEYGVLATLAPQLAPTIVEANRLLYGAIFQHGPEWLYGSEGRLRIEMLALVGIGLGCVAATRRWTVILATLATVASLGFLDATHSGWFERNWFGLFPLLCIGLAEAVARLTAEGGKTTRGRLAPGILAAFVLAGAPAWRPAPFWQIEMVTPPPQFLAGDTFFVASGFYHPESLVWRFPGKRFLGLPCDPALLDDLLRTFPDYHAMLWHPFAIDSLQRDLFTTVQNSPQFQPAGEAASPSGYRYLLVEKR